MARNPAARATYLAFRTGAAVAQALPLTVAAPTARVLAHLAVLAMPGRRRMVARHQRRVHGADLTGAHLDRAVNGVFDSYARYWLEMFRLPREARHGLDPHQEVEGWEHIAAGLDAGNGVIVALPHLGGWEYAGAWLAARGHHPIAVVEPVEPPQLFDWFAEQRRAIGIEIVPLGDGAARRLLGALRENRIVGLVCDRDLTGDGVEVDFFGEATTLPAGPATLALRTGAVLLPAAVYFEAGDGHRTVIRPPLPTARAGRLREDVARITQVLAREFETLIRAAPEQWHLLQPNWPSDSAGTAGACPRGRDAQVRA